MPSTDPERASTALDELNLVNAGYVADLYERYRSDPASVDDGWRHLFDSGAGGFEPVTAAAPATNGDRLAETAPAAAPPAEPAIPEGATAIKGPAAALARNMTASLAVPTATSFRDIDVAALEARRRDLNQQISPRKVSFTHLIGWAIVRSAAEQRSMSHYFIELEGKPY